MSTTADAEEAARNAAAAVAVKQVIRPLGDRIVVRPDEQERMHGKIIIPENIVEKPKTGIVLAVGSGNVSSDGSRTAPDVEEGAHVIFSQYGGVDVTLGDQAYLILREGDVLGEITTDPGF